MSRSSKVRPAPRPAPKEGVPEQATARAAADLLLAEIADLRAETAVLDKAAREELELVHQRYARLAVNQARLVALDHELKELMRGRRAEIFAEIDKVHLAHGLLIRDRELRVTIPREALSRLKELGLFEAIRVTESVDRGAVEAWPDQRLALIGAARRTVVKYGYEVAGHE